MIGDFSKIFKKILIIWLNNLQLPSEITPTPSEKVSIWHRDTFTICLFGTGTLLQIVYLAQGHFYKLFIWHGDTFTICLFGTGTL